MPKTAPQLRKRYKAWNRKSFSPILHSEPQAHGDQPRSTPYPSWYKKGSKLKSFERHLHIVKSAHCFDTWNRCSFENGSRFFFHQNVKHASRSTQNYPTVSSSSSHKLLKSILANKVNHPVKNGHFLKKWRARLSKNTESIKEKIFAKRWATIRAARTRKRRRRRVRGHPCAWPKSTI